MRLVSVPFADHCQPLLHCDEGRDELANFLPFITEQEHCDYIEVRLLDPEAVSPASHGLARSATFAYHWLDLRPDAALLYSRFHKSCFQRKIRRAERERLLVKGYLDGKTQQELAGELGVVKETVRRRWQHG